MTIQRRRLLQVAGVAGGLGLAGCTGHLPNQDPPGGAGSIGDGELVLATTTSTYDTGLLDVLNPAFRETVGPTVKTLSRGTGASLRTARDGDADVVLVHAREAEDRFLRAGYGLNRRDVMFNDFVIVGPAADPAGIRGTERAAAAFAAVADAQAPFLSRGDDSGTHTKERTLWAASDIEPSGSWYRLAGKGMGDTLLQASQIGAYTLADRGTYRSMRDELELVIMVQGPLEGGTARLKNSYGVIPVDPAMHPDVNYQAAMAYVGFLTGPLGQRIIGEYTANGARLFVPNALTSGAQFDQYVPREYCGSSRPNDDAGAEPERSRPGSPSIPGTGG